MRNIFLISYLLIFCFPSCKPPAEKNLRYKDNTIENISDKYIVTAVIQYYEDSAHPAKTQVITNMEPGEIRRIDSSGSKCVISKIRSAYYDELPDTSFFRNTVQMVAILATGAITLIASVLVFRYQRNRTSTHEIKILIYEMRDIIRHFERNIFWIDKLYHLDLSEGMPLNFYIKRFHTWKFLIKIPRKHTRLYQENIRHI